MNNNNINYKNNIAFFKVINNKFLINKIFEFVKEINRNENQISIQYNSIDSVEWILNHNHIELLYYKIKSNYKNLIFNKKSIVQLFKLIKQHQHNSNCNNSNNNYSNINNKSNNNNNNNNNNSNEIIKIIINNYFESQLKYYDFINLLAESGNLEAIIIVWDLYPNYYCNELAIDTSIYCGNLEVVDYLLKRKCKYTESRLVSNSFQSKRRSEILCYLLDKKLLLPGVKNQTFTKMDFQIIEQYLFDVDFQVIQYFESIGLFNSSSKQNFKSRNPLQIFKFNQNQLLNLYIDLEIHNYINQLQQQQQQNNNNNNNGIGYSSFNNSGSIIGNNCINGSIGNGFIGNGIIGNNDKFLKLNNELNSIYTTLQIFILYQKKFNNIDYTSDLNLQEFIIQANLSNSMVVEQFKRLYILFIKVVLHQNNKHQMFDDEDIYLLKARYAIQFNDITQLKSNLPLGKAFHDRYRFSLLFEMSIEYLNLDILLELIKNLPSDFINSFLLKSTPDERLYIRPMKTRLLKNTLNELNESRKETLQFIENLIHYYTNVIRNSSNKRRSYTGIPKQSSFDTLSTTSILRNSNPMSSEQQQDIVTSVIISLFDTMILHYPLEDISIVFKLIVDNEVGQYIDSFGTLKVSRNGASHSASRGNMEIFQFIYNNRAHFHWDHEVFESSLSKNPDIVQFLLKHMEHIINYQSSFDTATIYCNFEIIKILASNLKFELSESAYIRTFRVERVFEYLLYNRNEVIPSNLLGLDISKRIIKILSSIPNYLIQENPLKFQGLLSFPPLLKFKNPDTFLVSLLSNEYFYRDFIDIIINSSSSSLSLLFSSSSSLSQDYIIIQEQQYQQQHITPQALSKLFSRGQYYQVIKPVMIKMFSNPLEWIQSNYHKSCLKQIIYGFINRGQLSIIKKLVKHFNYIFFDTTPIGLSNKDEHLNQSVNQWYYEYIVDLGNYSLEKEEYNIFNYLAFDVKLFNFDNLNQSILLHSLQNFPISFVDHLFSNYSIDSLLLILKLNNCDNNNKKINNIDLNNNNSNNNSGNNNNNNSYISNNISNIKYIQSKYLNSNNSYESSNGTLKSLKKSFSKLFHK